MFNTYLSPLPTAFHGETFDRPKSQLNPLPPGSVGGCANCGKPATKVKLSMCARCKAVAYCSKKCQKAAWKSGHKSVCAAPKAAPTTARPLQNPCPRCSTFEEDEGEAVFCYKCGTFRYCGPCSNDPASAREGPEANRSPCCEACHVAHGRLYRSESDIGKLLYKLVHNRPDHNHAALILAKRVGEGELGFEQDRAGAAAEFLRLSEAGFAPAMAVLAEVLEASPSEGYFPRPADPAAAMRMFATAMDWLRRGAALNHCTALTNLGLHYKNGTGGVVQDKPRAARMFEEASRRNDAVGMCNWAGMLIRGDGIPPSQTRAEKLYMRAASEFNSANGQFMCYQLCRQPVTKTISMEFGLEMCRNAALQGFEPAVRVMEASGFTYEQWGPAGGATTTGSALKSKETTRSALKSRRQR